jgi:DNA-binding response OmpR family regulator
MVSADVNMNKLKLKFLERLMDNLLVFRKFTLQLKKSKVNEKELTDVRMRVHKISGTAAMFGYLDFGSEASALEAVFDKMIETSIYNVIPSTLYEQFDDFIKSADLIIISGLSVDSNNVSTVKNEDANSEKSDYSILLVDDDVLVGDLIKQELLEKKCKLECLLTGKKFIEIIKAKQNKLSAKKIDLVILDINLPETNGVEILGLLKSSEETRDIPVIMLTGSDKNEDIIKSISFGAVDFITKPFLVSDLIEKIFKVVEKHKVRVLVADDDELVCNLLERRLNSMGYMVVLAGNGREAWDVIESTKPDLVVLDIMMPAMDGMAVLKKIKRNQDYTKIPIILLSAKSQQESILEGLENGADDYITKPFDLDEVVARIVMILKRNKDV